MVEILDTQDIRKNAQTKFNDGEFLTAAWEFEKAANAYELDGDHVHAAEMVNNSSVSYLKAGEPRLALEILEHNEAFFRQSGDQHKWAIEVGNRGAALDALGEFDEAIRHYQSSADLFHMVGDDDLYISTIQAISSIELRRGKYREALETMRVGLSRLEKPTNQQRFLNRLFDIPLKILSR